MKVNIEVSIGELVDKLTILAIKLQHIKDKTKLSNIQKEFDLLNSKYVELLESTPELEDYFLKLREINAKIWVLEDEIRLLIKKESFEKEYIETAKKIHRSNDQRFSIKYELNKLLNSNLNEEKSYPEY